jgi:hypothetical protein
VGLLLSTHKNIVDDTCGLVIVAFGARIYIGLD